jgi:transposase
VKTDRRDAVTQASLFRSGELTRIGVPDDAHEAMRDLCRARQAAMETLRRARQQVVSFLLRHGHVYSNGGHWTRKHRLWLSARRFGHPARQIAFEELVQAVDEAQARRDRLAKQMQELLPSWSLAKVVTAIQALRGVALIAAITLVAEIGDFHRFANPRHLMAYLGLTPSERSSGAKTLRGAITKAGNTRARRVLVEGAWTYRLPARIGAGILKRNESLPQLVKDIAWKAQVRLCARHRRLVRAGKPANVVNVASARERRLRMGDRHERTRWMRLNKKKPSRRLNTSIIDIAAHRWRRRHGGAILDVILRPTKIDARLETEAGPRRIRGLAVQNPRIRV